MLGLVHLASLLALATHRINACTIEARQDNSDFLTIGNDGPADPETTGYYVNHFCLIVRNITATQEFYGNVLGMRHIFTVQLSPSYSVTYMGHSQGGKNGTGYQTGPELLREKNNAAGLIEFGYFKDSNDTGITASTERPNTFSHVGLIVPSLQDAQARMERFGVNITKRIGVSAAGIAAIENALGVGQYATTNQTEQELLAMGQQAIGYTELLVVEDPDGNMVEIQQLVPPPGVA